MGMFDSVMVPCPECGTFEEFQSKAGPRILATYYDPDDVPPAIAADLAGRESRCDNCGAGIHLRLRGRVWLEPQLLPDED